jgi:hypothetical protein
MIVKAFNSFPRHIFERFAYPRYGRLVPGFRTGKGWPALWLEMPGATTTEMGWPPCGSWADEECLAGVGNTHAVVARAQSSAITKFRF